MELSGFLPIMAVFCLIEGILAFCGGKWQVEIGGKYPFLTDISNLVKSNYKEFVSDTVAFIQAIP